VSRRCPAVVVVHRRQLPIVGHCEDFVPQAGAADEGGFCERCRKQVHDVSAMHESELRRFLAARAGTRACLSYRTDEHGRLRLRPEPVAAPRRAQPPGRSEPHPWALGALALLLAACAGHVSEIEAPGEVCRDEDGYAVSCPTWVDPSMQSVPEASAGCDPDEGCPVRPTTEAVDLESIVAEGMVSRGVVVLDVVQAAPLDAPIALAPGVESEATSSHVRVNFSIDPGQGFYRGAVVVSPNGWIDRDFVSTKDLWKQWRQRRAERNAARLRWRASQRTAASR
jgi:hypothetical protein